MHEFCVSKHWGSSAAIADMDHSVPPRPHTPPQINLLHTAAWGLPSRWICAWPQNTLFPRHYTSIKVASKSPGRDQRKKTKSDTYCEYPREESRLGKRLQSKKLTSVKRQINADWVAVRGLPVSPVPPHSFLSFPITSYFFAIISNLPRSFAGHRDHRRSLQKAAQPRTASPGFVTAAFQIWEAWYYTWSLVYTHSALTKVP